MKKQNNVLLISSNHDLHRTLELVASTCHSRFLGAETAKKGVNLIVAGEPDCVIFDLSTLPNAKHKQLVKEKVGKIGVPTLWLNDNGNGIHHPGNSQKLEPMVKFIMDTCESGHAKPATGLLGRFFSSRLFRHA